MPHERTTVKLSQLVAGSNARSDIKRISIDDLIASIEKRGLINPLIVTKQSDGKKYEVRAGGRRLRALTKLYKAQAKTYDVPVIVIPDDEAADSIALADNVVRVNLHPVDEYHQYSELIQKGLAPSEIAAEFGTSEKWVKQRLQLARLAPALLEDWRKGKMDAEQAKALSATSDHKAQERVWSRAREGRDPWWQKPASLREQVLNQVIKQDSAEFKLVGAEAYEAAGGTYSDDLFTDQRLVLDGDLVERLAEEALQRECALIREDGWLWVHTEESGDFSPYELVDHDMMKWATAEEAGALSMAGFVERRRILEAIRDRAIDDPNARAEAGVFVDVEADGSIRRRYFVDMPQREYYDHEAVAQEEPEEREDSSEPIELGERSESRPVENLSDPQASSARVNFALRERLSEILTAAVSRGLARSPKVALAAIIATLQVEIDSPFAHAPLRIKTAAWDGIAKPDAEADPRWDRTFEAALATTEFADKMLALLVSKTIDLRHPRYDDRQWSDRTRFNIIRALRAAVEIDADLHELFDPTDYFTRLTIAQISECLRHELNYSEGALPSGKAAMVKLASEKAKEARWLPVELR